MGKSDHQSEALKFSYQPIRKLETIQMVALLSLSVLFTSLFFGVLVFASKK